MTTTAQNFYLSTTEQDFTAASEVDIRKMLETAPGTNATTICTHPTAGGTTSITLDPYTTRTTQGDITANAGWAINRLGADGMDSTAAAKRTFLAGTWSFKLSAGIPAPTTLGSLSLTFVAKVYRVSSSGARTLLFTSGTSNALATTLLAANGLLTSTSSQSEYVLEADETIHVGYLCTLVQVAGTLGAVAGVCTFTVGTTAEEQQVPAPGVRTRVLQTHTGSATSSGALIRKPTKLLDGTVTPASTVTKRVTRPLVSSITPAGEVTKRVTRPLVGSLASAGALLKRPTKLLGSTITPGPSTIVRRPTKLLTSTVTPTSTLAFRVSKFFTGVIGPEGNVTKRPSKSFTGTITPGPSILTRRPTKLLQSTITPTANLITLITKNLRSDMALSGVLVKRVTKSMTGSITSAGTLRKTPRKFFTGVIGPEGGGGTTIIRRIRRLIVDD